MKSFLLASAAAIALTGTANAKGFTISTFGGANFGDVSYDNGWISAKDSTGYAIGAALGTSIDPVPGLSVEGELAFRSNGIDIDVCGDPLAATDRTWSIMSNARYRFATPSWPVHPVVLVGAGYGSRTASLDAYPAELTGQGFVVQAGAGLETQVAAGVHVGLEYRVFDAPNISIGDFESDGINQSVLLTATVNFN